MSGEFLSDELNAENSSLMLGTIEMGYLTLEEA